MVSKLKLALVLACTLLAGCATSTKYAPTNPANNEKLRAVQISYQLGLPKSVGVYVIKSALENGKSMLLQQVKEDTQLLTREVANQIPKQLIAAFKKRGVGGGKEETVFVKPLSALGSSKRHDIILTLEISVKPSGSTKPLWTAEISETTVPDDLAGEKISAILTNRILAELTKAGFIPAE